VVTQSQLPPPGPVTPGDSLEGEPCAAPAGLRAAARDAIRQLIASGKVRPGDRLSEPQLAAEIGTSRSPVREALRELEQQGLVVSYPNRGCFVATLSERDVDELVTLRAALEGLAARLASDRLNRLDLARLSDIVEQMARVGRDQTDGAEQARPLAELDAAFHLAIVQRSGHRRLLAVWESIDPLVWLIRLRGDSRAPSVAQLAAEHRELIDALKVGPDAAEVAARFHVVRGLDRPPQAWGGDLPPTPDPAPGAR
jgi:DNA-binding GntR family transcriptional regulator